MWSFPLLVVGTAIASSLPLGRYLAWVGDRAEGPHGFRWLERLLNTGPQNWKQYSLSLLGFNTVMYVIGFAVLAAQPLHPDWLNPDHKGMLAPGTVFNTVISFQSNTSLQHYSGEQHLSYCSQLTAILWNMFVSGGVSLCALLAIIRGLRGDAHMGNFYVDLWRSVGFVLFPVAIIVGIVLLPAGVPMTTHGSQVVETLGGSAQTIARGPVAALIPVKHLCSVGGGFFGANSAHPYENPNAWSNFVSAVSMLLFPCAVVVMFGRMLNNSRHAAVLYVVMTMLLAVLIGWTVYWDTLHPNPALGERPKTSVEVLDDKGATVQMEAPALAGLPVDQRTGNLEGKELRFGPAAGPTFAAISSSVACGSADCAHDSLNPLAGLGALVGMWLNSVFGGKGAGLINLLLYTMVCIFFTGLMVGRTPEYLGKKIEAREMKLAMFALLVHPFLILVPTALFAVLPWSKESTTNPGGHGFSQIIYEFSSASANNGSEFAGLQQTYGNADNPNPAPYALHWDVATGVVMLLSRFLPLIAALALAGGLAVKKPTPHTVGTLRTDTVTFACVLLGTVLLLGALLFLPAAMLGPGSEHFGPIPFGQ
jgi:K+-transporting ATPase ATPase A chain